MMPQEIEKFLSSCPSNYDFPIGGSNYLILEAESDLLSFFKTVNNVWAEDFTSSLSMRGAYDLVIFSVRSAVYAVRKKDQVLLLCGLGGLFIGGRKIDWRDLLGALAIIEDCGNRIGINLKAEVEALLPSLPSGDFNETLKGYFDRSDKMRAVDVLGFEAEGSNENLIYRERQKMNQRANQ